MNQRDPERIQVILEKLKLYWEANPDLRLGQIISNIADYNGVIPFYLEDSVALKVLLEDLGRLK